MPISAEMLTHLSGAITTLCVATKLTEIKPDGTSGDIIRFVNHTSNLIIGGETYLSLPLPPTQLQQTEGLEPDNMQITVALKEASLFSTSLIRARKWMGARVEYQVINYEDTSMGAAVKKIGYIGKTRVERFTATPELRSLSQLLEQQIGDVTSEDCRVVELGDSECNVDLDGTTVDGYVIKANATVTGVLDKQRFTVSYSSSLMGATAGLLAGYFNGTGFNVPVLTRIDSNIDFNFGASSPAPGVNTSFYSIRWNGKINPRYSETYTFTAVHDDGVKVWVNGTLIIDQWGTSGTHTGNIALTADTPVDLVVEFFNNVGNSDCTLKWQSTSQALEVVPSSRLAPPPVTTAPDTHWARGNAEWLTGDNEPQRIKVLGNVGNLITLYLTTNRTIQIGDTLLLTAGCNRKRATCRDKFANILNFRGEPDLPGRTKLLKFPA